MSSTGSASPAPSPTFTAAAFQCPTSDGTSSVAVGGGSQNVESSRHIAAHRRVQFAARPDRLAVTYDLAALSSRRSQLTARETSLGANAQRELTFANTGTAIRIIRVDPSKAQSIAAQLRTEAGVRSVSFTGERRVPLTVNAPYFTNEPYFNGFMTTNATSAGATPPPATYHVAPYEEGASVPGQWDMHAIRLDYAFAYSQSNNGSGITNANALGSSGVKIAVIDTGADTLHPKLKGKAIYQKCFVTNPNNVQSTSNFSTDPQGHGTDTSGLATDALNSGIGFVGAGGNSSLYSYRVFPTPDDNCLNENTTDNQCGSDTADIAAAINDAVAQHVNVISMSLGGGSCNNGVDSDATEGAAVANAIAANIVVVAAAGNSGTLGVSSPACDSGVIAAGASALSDGQPNGSGISVGSAATPVEYVASYSQYGSPASAYRNTSAWGIVAPGGDPINDNDADDLHWIDNIWTSTPFDNNFAGGCYPDYPNGASPTGTADCRTLIAGTSMATPIVAGTAALIIALNSSYQSPTKMKQLLCSTTTDIGDPHEGCGRLDAYRAVATVLGDPKLP
jgi:subtilisin family serine protease